MALGAEAWAPSATTATRPIFFCRSLAGVNSPFLLSTME